MAGMISLYHHTTEANAKAIMATGSFVDRGYPRKHVAHFSDVAHGFYGREYGSVAVQVQVPAQWATETDSFNDRAERFYTVPVALITAENIIRTL